MRPIKLIIFDLDGTTADTLDGIVEALNRTMAACGYPLHDRASTRQFVNLGVRAFTVCALPEEKRQDAAEVDRVTAMYLRNYSDTYTMTRPFDGMAELLDRLADKTLLAMNSNKQDEFVKVLAGQLFRKDLFVAAEGFLDSRPGKPDPTMALDIMRMASEKLGETLEPQDCVYIGDSDIDFYTARNAGMRLVSVSWGYRPYAFLRALGDQPIARTNQELYEILCREGLDG